MTVSVHPSMVAALTDDTQKYNDELSLLHTLENQKGWGNGTSFEIFIDSPSRDAPIALPLALLRNIDGDGKSVMLDVFIAAQAVNVQTAARHLKDRYGIVMETYEGDPHETNDEGA